MMAPNFTFIDLLPFFLFALLVLVIVTVIFTAIVRWIGRVHAKNKKIKKSNAKFYIVLGLAFVFLLYLVLSDWDIWLNKFTGN